MTQFIGLPNMAGPNSITLSDKPYTELFPAAKPVIDAVLSDAPCGLFTPYNLLPTVDGWRPVPPSELGRRLLDELARTRASLFGMHVRLFERLWHFERPVVVRRSWVAAARCGLCQAWLTARNGMCRTWSILRCRWESLPHRVRWAMAGVVGSASLCCAIKWYCDCRRRLARSVARTVYDGQESIAFCSFCSPQLMDDSKMMLGNAYEKKFLVPAACPRCSKFWFLRGTRTTRFRIGNSHYQFLGTYAGMRMQRERDVHCPMVNQLDVPNEYRFAHRFLQFHAGTISDMEHRATWSYNRHTRSYRMATQWDEIEGGNATLSSDQREDDANTAQLPPPTNIQRMRQLWQFIYDNGRMYPQSTLVSSTWARTRQLVGHIGGVVYDTTAAARLAMLGSSSRQRDQNYMTPPPGVEMTPIANAGAQAVGPVTHPVTVHNSQDRTSVLGVLEGRSSVKRSVFPNADGTFSELKFDKSSKAAHRLNRFWRKFNQTVLTDRAIDNAYQKLFADKKFEEITMSKFSAGEIEKVRTELQTTTKPEWIGTRKANGKLEPVVKELKPGRVVVDNTLQLLAVNIISTSIFQHLLFDHDDGIFYSMSIKHRPRDKVLDQFGKMMKNPWGIVDEDTCAWEIDQTGMELHERCNKHGEGLLGYTYNALMRINARVAHKLNAEFVGLHTAKIVLDVKTGMRIRFRMKGPAFPKDRWFTAKFPDMYLDSGWALTSGVNFINELSGVYCSVAENPEHLFAYNTRTNKFRLQDNTFDWKFKSIPLYQTTEATVPASFPIKLRGLFEGDDGGGAGSRCLADPRNGGAQGLIVRQQEDLGYSAKLKTIIRGRVEIIGAHFPVRGGLVCGDVPWMPDVKRYTSKLGTQTNVRITPNSQAARFLSLASMFAGRIEPFQRGFELSATRVIEKHGKDPTFWTAPIRTDGYHEIDRAFGDGTCCTYTMDDIKAHYDRCANIVHQPSDVQIRMLNMSIASDVDANVVTRSDFAKLGLFAEECRSFGGDDESAYCHLPASFR